MVESPLPNLNAWIAHFIKADIPVLRHTMQQLDKLREKAQSTNARKISSVIVHDPLMMLRVLAYIESKRSKSRRTDITTMERAQMMIGMEPFFNTFRDLPLVENHLKAHPRALLGLIKVVNRSRHAMHWARDWAAYRHDLDVDDVIVAAMLYDYAEILMWCFAPKLALQVTAKQQADPTLRSVAVQTEVFGVPLYQIKQALAQAWQLPNLLNLLMDPEHAEHPRVRNVKLAIDLARHSANGWDNAAIPDDLKLIGELLGLNNRNALIKKLGLSDIFPPEEEEE